MPAVEICAGRELANVFRFVALLAIPPGAVAVEIGSDLGSACDRHAVSIAQIF